MNAVREYRPMVSQETLLEMAEEKLLKDEEQFCEWLTAETMAPSERRPSRYFSFISSKNLLTEVLMKPRASQEQLAEAWKELRRRYLEDHQEKVTREFERLMADEEAQ